MALSYLDMVRRITEAENLETRKSEKEAKKVRSLHCVECGRSIGLDEPETWWGRDRVHLACGRQAWSREWKKAEAPAEHLSDEGDYLKERIEFVRPFLSSEHDNMAEVLGRALGVSPDRAFAEYDRRRTDGTLPTTPKH